MLELLLVIVVFAMIGYFNYKAIIQKSEHLKDLYIKYYFDHYLNNKKVKKN